MKETLSNKEILRYSRHLILPSIGIKSQNLICKSSVLVIGIGGLGSPLLQYLSGAGVGSIGIIDKDIVELTNLPRQIIHKEKSISKLKVESAYDSIKEINSNINVSVYKKSFNSKNAIELCSKYDVIVDCTDNIPTRYLINDASVQSKKPLVSAGCIGLHGQVSVYNFNNGPCYRCIHPIPPPSNSYSNCSDYGVLNILPGIIGSIQALEVLKIIGNFGKTLSGKLLIFDAADSSFNIVKLREKNCFCTSCGISKTNELGLVAKYSDSCCSNSEELVPSISCVEYNIIRNKAGEHILIDVRKPEQYEICCLPNSINIPFDLINENPSDFINIFKNYSKKSIEILPVYIICRRGRDSLKTVKILIDIGINNV